MDPDTSFRIRLIVASEIERHSLRILEIVALAIARRHGRIISSSDASTLLDPTRSARRRLVEILVDTGDRDPLYVYALLTPSLELDDVVVMAELANPKVIHPREEGKRMKHVIVTFETRATLAYRAKRKGVEVYNATRILAEALASMPWSEEQG